MIMDLDRGQKERGFQKKVSPLKTFKNMKKQKIQEERKMCDNAKVYVRNNLLNNQGKIKIEHPGGSDEVDFGLESNTLRLPDLQAIIKIILPAGVRIDKCHLHIGTDVDFILNLPADPQDFSYWTIRIAPNNRDCLAPTTVNITVSDDRP